jgi:drug/metabolite transporter (DMT)-like permease
MDTETPVTLGAAAEKDRIATLKGMVLMGVAAAIISVMHVLVRDLSSEINPIQIAFYRNVIGFMMLFPFLLRQDRSLWITKQPKLQFFRAIIGTCALLSWFTALGMMPVGDATAISFVTVLFVTIGAALVLKEKVGVRRWTAILVGFVGTLIIIRPGSGIFGAGALVALMSTVFWAAALICVKILSRTDSSITMVFYANVFFTIFSFIPALFFWTWPTLEQTIWMVLIGVMATLGHLCMAQSLKMADATAVAPMDYTRMLFAAGVGFLMFGEFPDAMTWVGGTVIFISTVYITYRESRAKRAAVVPATPTPTARS